MTQIDLSEIYTPDAGQAEVHRSTAKTKVLEMGRRRGKSRLALFELIRRFVESLEIAVPASKIPPFHAWIVAPTFPQSRQAWNELMAFLPKELIQPGGVHTDDQFIYLRGNEKRKWGLIEVKSAHDPDALQTAGLDFLWVTEAQDVSNRAFERLLPVLRSPDAMGYGVFEGIPALYQDHWFWRLCDVAESNPDYFFKRATTFDNPHLTEAQRAEIQKDKEVLPLDTWNRLYLAIRSSHAGYFRNIDACIGGDLLSQGLPVSEYVAGLDLGRLADPSDMTIMDARERRVVGRVEWQLGTDWPLMREGVMKASKAYNLSRLVVDATGMGGDIFVSELLEANLPVEAYVITSNSRDALLMQLAVAMERETVSLPRTPMLLRQLRAFQLRKTTFGNWRAEAPPGEHDDAVFSFALALTACAEPAGVLPNRSGNRQGRYMPTQDEAETGVPTGRGSAIIRQRREQRWARKTNGSNL
mgnify:CR=1 FL=1